MQSITDGLTKTVNLWYSKNMITAKKAKKISEEYVEDFKTLKSVSDHIKELSALGFTNTSIYVDNTKSIKMAKKLKSQGYNVYIGSVYIQPELGKDLLEIEWY